MAAPSTFTADTALEAIDEELTFTLSILRRYDFAAQWATQYEALLQRCDAIGLEQRKLRRAMTAAQGQVNAADLALDALVDLVDLTVATATGKDASHPLRRLLFQDWRAAELKRPALGAELEVVRAWPELLRRSEIPALIDLAPRVEAAVTAADAAVSALADAQNVNREFRLTGARKRFIDEVNALRASSFGALKEHQHKHPELLLPSEFAGELFRRKGRGSKTTVDSVDAQLASLQADLELLQAQRAKLLAAQQAAQQAERETAAKQLQLELAEAEAAAERAAKRVSELKAQLS
jgi:hypothetical protein